MNEKDQNIGRVRKKDIKNEGEENGIQNYIYLRRKRNTGIKGERYKLFQAVVIRIKERILREIQRIVEEDIDNEREKYIDEQG